MRDEPLEGRDERGPDRRVARKRDFSGRSEDAIPIVRRRIARREDESRFREVHLAGDPEHLRGRESGRAVVDGERVPCHGRVREHIDAPEIEEPLGHGGDLAADGNPRS